MIVNVPSKDNITGAVPAALKAQFGVNSVRELANHVIYCLPPIVVNGSSVFDSGLGIIAMKDDRYELQLIHFHHDFFAFEFFI